MEKNKEKPVDVKPVAHYVTKWSYPVKFICGKQETEKDSILTFRPGTYATDINILNYDPKNTAIIWKRVYVLKAKDIHDVREPNQEKASYYDNINLKPLHATFDDCVRLAQLAGQSQNIGLISMGFFEIVSSIEINVTAVYTVTDINGASTDIEVVPIQGKQVLYPLYLEDISDIHNDVAQE